MTPSLSRLGTDTSIQIKLGFYTQTSPSSEMMRLCNRFPHASNISTLRHNLANIVVIKNAIIYE